MSARWTTSRRGRARRPAIEAQPSALVSRLKGPPNGQDRSFVFWSLIVLGLGAPRAYGVTSGLNLGSNALKFAALTSLKPASLAKDAILSGSGDVGGQSISLATGASAGADVVANPKGITLGTDAVVAGACVTAGAKIKLRNGAKCASQDTIGSDADLRWSRLSSCRVRWRRTQHRPPGCYLCFPFPCREF